MHQYPLTVATKCAIIYYFTTVFVFILLYMFFFFLFMLVMSCFSLSVLYSTLVKHFYVLEKWIWIVYNADQLTTTHHRSNIQLKSFTKDSLLCFSIKFSFYCFQLKLQIKVKDIQANSKKGFNVPPSQIAFSFC